MANAPIQLDDDLEVVERRTDARIVLNLPGRFKLASRRDTAGQRREFPCRAVNLSCHAVTLATPINGEVGERVIAQIEQFGKLEGPIMHAMQGGFVVEIIAQRRDRERLATKIEWYEKFKNHDVANQRDTLRIMPKDPYSTLVFADGTTIECIVLDVSASGTAVMADIVPEIGTPVAVGKLVGRVIRHFRDGFAVQFAQLQELDQVERLIGRLAT
jgi:hypothetical protein